MTRPTVEEYAVYSLYKNAVPMTVAEIAADIGYSHGYTREALRDLRSRHEVEGAKIDPVIACSVHGKTIVLTSNFQGMINSLEKASVDLAERAESEVTRGDIEELQTFIRRHATNAYPIEYRWEFWYPTTTPPTGASSSPAAPADD